VIRDPEHHHGLESGRAIYRVPDAVHAPLYVITPVMNAIRFKSRWKHYQRFAKHVKDAGGTLVTVEAAFGERDWALDDTAPECLAGPGACNADQCHQYVKLRSSNELWLKENLINVGVSRLPHDWRYVAWIDADVAFLRPNWVGECIQQLQHYKFLQMFSHAQDLDPGYAVAGHRPGFVWAWENTGEVPPTYYYDGGKKRPGAWSGLAWACTRQAWDEVGGLPDFCITGAADWYMAYALFGQVEKVIPEGSALPYHRALVRWQERAEKYIRRNVGFMTGTVAHMWHGKKSDRRYMERSRLLAELKFDPNEDLKRDWQGLHQLEDHGDARSIELRDRIRVWFRSRNEDSIDV
jgi:hypothetical protein